MALNREWMQVNEALRRWEALASVRPTIVAMARAAELLRESITLDDLHPRLSHMWLSLGREGRPRRVGIGWVEASPAVPGEPTGYRVWFIEPSMEITERKSVGDDELVDVVRERLKDL